MRVEYLSDHAGDTLRDSEDQQRQASYDNGLAEVQQREAEAMYRAARRSKQIWKRVLSIPSAEEKQARHHLEVAQRQHAQAFDRQRQLDHKVQQQAAGVQGEHTLASFLSSALSDDWVMLGGYRNRNGEADLVLVGPSGIWAIEVKNRNARLHADGDRWWFQKLDRWGNVVKTGPATDNKNRTWGRQAGDVADSLVWWLERNQQHVPVRTAVMLIHPRASLGRIRHPGVDLVSTDPQELLRAMTASASVVEAGAQTAIVELIRRDHRHHNERRRRRD